MDIFQEDINSVQYWANKWVLKLLRDKCGTHNNQIERKYALELTEEELIKNHTLKTIKEERYLRV